MKIKLRTLNEGERHFCGYPTCGDWQHLGDNRFQCTVDQMKDPDSEFVILVHEMVEAWLCKKHGIDHEAVSDFDKIFEAEREAGKHSEMAEPGDDPRAPYRKEHQFATLIEMLILHECGQSWADHCREVANAGPT